MKQLPYIISIITLLVTLSFAILIGYWMIYPYEAMTIENADAVKVDKAVYKPGERVIYTFEYCKKTDLPATVYRTLSNSIRINYADFVSTLPKGCGKITSNEVIIPDFVDNGVYHIEATAVYKVNPIRDFIHKWRTVDFRIER